MLTANFCAKRGATKGQEGRREISAFIRERTLCVYLLKVFLWGHTERKMFFSTTENWHLRPFSLLQATLILVHFPVY